MKILEQRTTAMDNFAIDNNETDPSVSPLTDKQNLLPAYNDCKEDDIALFHEELQKDPIPDYLVTAFAKKLFTDKETPMHVGIPQDTLLRKPNEDTPKLPIGSSVARDISTPDLREKALSTYEDNPKVQVDSVNQIKPALRKKTLSTYEDNPKVQVDFVNQIKPALRKKTLSTYEDNPKVQVDASVAQIHTQSALDKNFSRVLLPINEDGHKSLVDSSFPNPLPVLGETVTTSDTPIALTTQRTLTSHNAFIAQQIREQIVDRILVSTTELNDNRLVKITFSPQLLAGTEVNFQKAGATLSVHFVSTNVQSIQFLQNIQLDLQSYLQGNLKDFKDVAVSVEDRNDVFEDARDGRSRNRFAYQSSDDAETMLEA